MLDKVKRKLVGLSISDVGMVKVRGHQHAILRLSNTYTMYVPWENVIITVESSSSHPAKRPVAKSLTMIPQGVRIRTGTRP